MDENEIRQLQEENRCLKEERDAGARELEDARARLAERDSAFGPVKKELEKVKGELAGRDAEMEKLKEGTAGLSESLARAVNAYREEVIRATPGLTHDLVSGETVEEVNASLEKAKGVIESVRKSLEDKREEGRVPAGAPPRSTPDLSSLSPAEKIKYAIGGNSNR